MHDVHDTRPTRAMVVHTCGAHQGAGVTLACLQVNRDLMAAGEERDKGEGRGVGGKGKGEVRTRGKLVVTAPCMAVCIRRLALWVTGSDSTFNARSTLTAHTTRIHIDTYLQSSTTGYYTGGQGRGRHLDSTSETVFKMYEVYR